MTNDEAQAAAKQWAGEAGGKLCPQLTENELTGIVNEATGELVKELRAARRAMQKMKASCNKFDEAFEIGTKAIERANKALKQFRQPVAMALPDNAKVSGAGTAPAGLSGYAAGGNGERK